VQRHAEILVNWSTDVSEGEMVMIRAGPDAHELVSALAGEIARKKASYMVLLESDEVLRTYLNSAGTETLSLFPKHYASALQDSDVVIWIDAPRNGMVLADTDPEKLALRARTREPLFEMSLRKKWCDTLHPCETLAKRAGMELEEYKEFVYGAIIVDWERFSGEMSALCERLNRHENVRFKGPETDLFAQTSGRIWLVEDGKHNMPSGEVYASPIEESVEGRIFFDIPFMYQGHVVEGVRLKFQRGVVSDYSAEKGERALKSIIEVDDGSNRIGEIAIGMNHGIKRHTMNMLFDEKMGNTIHCALGKALTDCNGTNESSIHVDMIKSMHSGEVIAGNETIYSHGEFIY